MKKKTKRQCGSWNLIIGCSVAVSLVRGAQLCTQLTHLERVFITSEDNMFPHTVYLRPNPRLPKVIALGVLLDYIRQKGGTLPQVHMVPADEQRAGTGTYHLASGPHPNPERHYPTD